jgi:hypothetical protein
VRSYRPRGRRRRRRPGRPSRSCRGLYGFRIPACTEPEPRQAAAQT